ncbi:MAG TPA: hypothetical protein DCZ91_16295 [Lachnospiraceae bacterium]|nr:hypothetical protein [Lachnospiraceae bacterium]
MDRMQGSMGTLSAMQLTADTAGLDAECKLLLHRKEVISVILKGTVEEYEGYSMEEIMDFIEADSIEEIKEVSANRTNTQVRGDNVEFAQLNEKVSFFDMLLRAKNPALSEAGILVNLRIDIEPQKDYRPGYPIEKRGLYYLARLLSAQLSLITEQTDYRGLEKCYSIWICRDNIPKDEQYSISFYEIANTRNIGNCTVDKKDYDLIKLVIIRLGDKVYNGDEGSEGYRLLRFLNAIMYPHEEGFMDTISEYIDFSANEELWKETNGMFSLGQCILEDGKKEGMEKGIRALVMDNLEEHIPVERIIEKLQRHFNLSRESAQMYYEKFTQEE